MAFLSRVVVEVFWAVAFLHETNRLFVETFEATVVRNSLSCIRCALVDPNFILCTYLTTASSMEGGCKRRHLGWFAVNRRKPGLHCVLGSNGLYICNGILFVELVGCTGQEKKMCTLLSMLGMIKPTLLLYLFTCYCNLG